LTPRYPDRTLAGESAAVTAVLDADEVIMVGGPKLAEAARPEEP